MKDQKIVEWVKGRNGRIIVTLPDGSDITVHTLVEQIGIGKQSAHKRIKKYIEDGCLEDLMKGKSVQSKRKPKTNKLSKTHYESGDLRMYVDPFWKVLAKI